ncbi:Hypothetical predicted protein [Olea europaea subsp. europaea]|nr:Hypothetical predicted protein [Olea europaea subsp. europaea]
MDNSQFQSQRSLSTTNLSNQSLNQYSGTGSTSNCSEFINHGFMRWNQTRLLWNGSKKSQSKGKVQEPVLNWNASYESLLGTSKRFPQRIPLSVSGSCHCWLLSLYFSCCLCLNIPL